MLLKVMRGQEIYGGGDTAPCLEIYCAITGHARGRDKTEPTDENTEPLRATLACRPSQDSQELGDLNLLPNLHSSDTPAIYSHDVIREGVTNGRRSQGAPPADW